MTETGTSGTAPRWPRWKGILLVVSLAFNLLILGIVAAAGIRHGWGPPPGGAQQATLLRFARSLPAERKKEIWAAIRPELRSVRPHWRELRKARAEVRAALTTDPFDVARFQKAHDHLLDVEVKVRKELHPVFDDVASRLTPQERREFARWQLEAEPKWRRRKDRDHHHDNDDAEEKTQGAADAPSAATAQPGKP